MISFIEVRERGATPGQTKRVFNRVSKSAWFDAALFDHNEHADDPFTEAGRLAGGFPKRRGQNLTPGSKAFKRSYYGRKFASAKLGGGPGQALPNVFTGESRRRAKFVRSTSTSGGFVNRYAVPRLNFKNPNTQVHPANEFRFRSPKQVQATADACDHSLDRRLAADTTATTTTVR